jgi:hypothetical protein
MKKIMIATIMCFLFLSTNLIPQNTQFASAQVDNPNPPIETVKLIFIHHSTGENWLADDYGNLGRALADNNYFVSDTNYGWGPDAIGDRTDILNWPEWFRGPNVNVYMQALFNESEQHASYTRLSTDPGGENEIIMFKSCFPNSAIEGSPNDPPTPGDELTVGNAKYIYNDLLNYFITRPDKLFIVITAPPLIDSTYADNARAFNLWLVRDWLVENNYPYSNVAVFDFYNILTDPNNHYRFNNGTIEYITDQGGNSLYYDSDGDDHPNPSGSQKATNEFVPLLNIFYNRWKSGGPVEPPVVIEPTTEPSATEPAQPTENANQPTGESQITISSGTVDDFDGTTLPNTQGWETFLGESDVTTIDCTPTSEVVHEGKNALQLNFNIAANDWATCALLLDTPISWQDSTGIGFYLKASEPSLVFDIIIYGGSADDRSTYEYTVETTPESAETWVYIELAWDNFLRAAWEENAGSPLNPSQITGIAFGFDTFPDTPNIGQVWVDDIKLIGSVVSGAQSAPTQSSEEPLLTTATSATTIPAEPTTIEKERSPLCSGVLVLPFITIGIAFCRKRWHW